MSKEIQFTADSDKIKVFFRVLCARNLINQRVTCCSACPWEEAIIRVHPEAADLFESKRARVRESGGRWAGLI